MYGKELFSVQADATAETGSAAGGKMGFSGGFPYDLARRGAASLAPGVPHRLGSPGASPGSYFKFLSKKAMTLRHESSVASLR